MKGKPGKAKNWFVLLLLVAAVIWLAAASFHLYELARVGSGYYAKMLCSGVFVSHRPADAVTAEDVKADMADILKNYSGTVDRENNTVTASIFGFAAETALYREGLGCTLLVDKSVADLKAQSIGLELDQERSPALWPDGDLVDLTEASGSFDRKRLDAAVNAAFDEPDPAKLRRTRAVVVVHKGRIVAERYADGISPQTPLLGWSMTKTVTNALTGILVKQGKISVDQKNLFPSWRDEGDPRADITVDDLLRMSSGLYFDEGYDDDLSDVRLMLFREPNTGAYAADKPLAASPGSHWEYSSGTTNILTEALKHAYGGTAQDFLAFPKKALFAPLGMTTAVFEPDASGNLVGSSYMYASARDWARFGLLYLQQGNWNGEPIFTKDWLTYSLTPTKGAPGYGAHIWLKLDQDEMGPAPLKPEIPDDAYFMLGHDGQIVAVLPSRDLVIVRLGLSRAHGGWHHGPLLSGILAAFP